jgi:Zn-dependent M28 family amino/carboxypeptidase
MLFKFFIILLFPFALMFPQLNGELANSLEAINEETLRRNIEILSSDEFMGRQPSTEGEEKTINFLKDEFQKLGLKPGNGSSFFQEVPLVEVLTGVDETLKIKTSEGDVSLRHKDEYVANSAHLTNEIKIENAELIFAGYGIVAPEYNWNDYEGINAEGKIVVVLINDPGFVKEEEDFFTGKAMTYYGRWTYKYEEAARQGADGILIVHETAAASYPWDVVRNGWTGSQFYLVSDDNNFSRCKLEGWINNDKARELFQKSGFNFDEAAASALSNNFKPFSLNSFLSITLKNNYEESISNNVIALYEGSSRKDEYIIFTAHWDHFGIDTTLEGDQIYSGAKDNATGTAALISLAEAFTKLPERQERSILFLAVTAEEQGLLGSQYYAENPLYPLNKTAAVVNMDALNVIGRMKDMVVIGYGKSELDRYVEEAAEKQDRIVRGDPSPERGTFYRSDHFSFAKKGVPSLYAKGGTMHVEKGEEWGLEQAERYTAHHYHKPSDVIEEWWDFSGMVEDLQLIFYIAYQLSNDTSFPNWNEGDEFRAIRDEQMSER